MTDTLIEALINKKFEELKLDILKSLQPSSDIKQLNDKLDATIKAQEEFTKKTQNLLMLIDGTYNNISSVKTPTKIQTRKPRQNNNVIDITTPSEPQHQITFTNTSAPLPPMIDEKTDIPKPKYRIKCINAIMDGIIKLSDLESNCNINITEVKKQLADIKSSTTLNHIEKKEKFKTTLKDFIYSIGDIQTEKLKKYISEKLQINGE